MATSHVRPAPARDAAPRTERPELESSTSRLEDKIDYLTVRHARALASKRGEKPTAWKEFKKNLAR